MEAINVESQQGISLALYYTRVRARTQVPFTPEKLSKVREHILKYEYMNQHELNGVLGERLGKKLVQWLGITTVKQLKTISKEYIATLRGEGIQTYTLLCMIERIGCIPFKPYDQSELSSFQLKKMKAIYLQLKKANSERTTK